MYEWDEDKRRKVPEKHGPDFRQGCGFDLHQTERRHPIYTGEKGEKG